MGLDENAWSAVHTFALVMYSSDDTVTELLDNPCMRNLKSMIHYDAATFCLNNYEAETPVLYHMTAIGIPQSQIKSGKTRLNTVPHSWVNDYAINRVVRDSDLFDDFTQVEYYKDMYATSNLKYALTIKMAHNEMNVGVLSLFRYEEYGDFNELEVNLARLISDHLSIYAYHLYDIKRYKKQSIDLDFASKKAREYGLTQRELDVLTITLEGHTAKEISAELYISEATVKKHLSRIYYKMGISSKRELISKLL